MEPATKVSTLKYRVLIEQDEAGAFVAHVPALPGCMSQGSSRDEALANLREAIEGYLESLREQDEPILPTILEKIVEPARCVAPPDARCGADGIDLK